MLNVPPDYTTQYYIFHHTKTLFRRFAIVESTSWDDAYDVLVDANEVLVRGKIILWDRARVCVGVKTPTDLHDLFIMSPTTWYDAYGNKVAGGASTGVVDSDGKVNGIVINTTLDASYDEKQVVSLIEDTAYDVLVEAIVQEHLVNKKVCPSTK